MLTFTVLALSVGLASSSSSPLAGSVHQQTQQLGVQLNPKIRFNSDRKPIASETIYEGESLVTLPLSNTLNINTLSRSAPPLLKRLTRLLGSHNQRQLMAMYVISQRFNKSSPLHSYMQLLPDRCVNGYTFTHAEIEAFGDSQLVSLAHEMQQKASTAFRDMWGYDEAQQLFSKHCTVEEGRIPSCWFWANCIVSSRCFSMDLPHEMGSSTQLSLMVPGADMFNHLPRARSSLELDYSTGELALVTQDRHNVGSEILVSYGHKSSQQLILNYGFATSDNPDDSIIFDRMDALPLGDPNPATKLRIAALIGITQSLRLTWKGLHGSGMSALRLLRLEASDLSAFSVARVLRGRVVNTRNELSVAKSLYEMCRAQLIHLASFNSTRKWRLTRKAVITEPMIATAREAHKSLLRSCLAAISGEAVLSH